MKPKEPTKKVKIDIDKMGVDIDKNEYREIVLSQTNRPTKPFESDFWKNSTRK